MKEPYKGLPGWKAIGFKSYQEYLESDWWKRTRDIILESHPFCEKCGSKKSLVVHHKHYETVTNESIKDLMVLCWKCHNEEHKGKGEDSSK